MFLKNDELKVRYIDGKRWELLEDFAYEHKGVLIEVPAGFITDFASIPRILWSWMPPVGKGFGKAGVIHDWLYFHGHLKGEDITRQYADEVLRDACRDLGTNRVRRNIIYAGVRAGGWVPWNKYRRRDEEGEDGDE
jgi:hypothetical protein